MKINLALILLIVGVLIVGYSFLGGSSIGDIIGTNPVKQITCDVQVRNIPLTGGVVIDKFTCQSYTVNRCPLFSVGTLSIISDKYNVVVSSGGITKTTPTENILEGITEIKTLSLCVGEEVNSASAQVRDENNVVLDTETISI